MATKTSATPLGVDEDEDELDQKIDAFLGRAAAVLQLLLIGALVGLSVYWPDPVVRGLLAAGLLVLAVVVRNSFNRLLAILGLLGVGVYGFLWPSLGAWGQYIVLALYLIFQLFFAMTFMIVQFVALFWFLGRPRMYWVMPGETGVGFKDYKGNPEVLEAARQVVVLLRGVRDFKAMGGQPIRGLLLIGPPGTGKSYLGQCISTEAGVPFGYLSAPSIQGMFWGMDVLRVWSLYRKARSLARKYGGCILFIDEIDAIGRSRAQSMPGMGFGGLMMGGGSAALNQLLNEMEPMPRDTWRGKLLRKLGLKRGRAEDPPVLTMAATNLAEILDAALLRPGRFDRKIVVDLPSAEGRREIIEYYLARVKHEPLPIDRLVYDTIGYTPVAIKYVINEAVVHAHWNGRDAITYQDFRRAVENHEWGLRQPILGMSREEKRRIAYHEAGHAVAMVKLLPSHRLAKVTIIRHGQALGLAAPKPIEERYTETREEILADIQVSLASRAAEQLFLGTELTGVHSDLEHATQIAAAYVRLLGMHGSLYSARAFGEVVPDQWEKKEIDKILDQQFRAVRAMLQENSDVVVAVAEQLLEKEELTGDEVLEIIREVESRRPVAHHNGRNGRSGTPVFGLPPAVVVPRPPALPASSPGKPPSADPAPAEGAPGQEQEQQPRP